MADDRVFIKCKQCEGWKMLLKHFSIEGVTTRDNGILEWLDTHAFCNPEVYGPDLGNNPGFTLHTENDLMDGITLKKDKQNSTG